MSLGSPRVFRNAKTITAPFDRPDDFQQVIRSKSRRRTECLVGSRLAKPRLLFRQRRRDEYWGARNASVSPWLNGALDFPDPLPECGVTQQSWVGGVQPFPFQNDMLSPCIQRLFLEETGNRKWITGDAIDQADPCYSIPDAELQGGIPKQFGEGCTVCSCERLVWLRRREETGVAEASKDYHTGNEDFGNYLNRRIEFDMCDIRCSGPNGDMAGTEVSVTSKSAPRHHARERLSPIDVK